MDYAQKTIFRHIALIQLCFSRKRQFVEKPVRVNLPEPRIIGNLDTNCREIIEDKGDDVRSQQDFYQADENAAGEDATAHEQQEAEDQQNDNPGDVDPDDPLYGLEQRLRNLNLDEESRRIIKDKLDEANNRIKLALEDRQKNLDAKIQGGAAGAAGAKKKWFYSFFLIKFTYCFK